MYKQCQRYVSDPHTTLTILNDSFLKVFKNIALYREECGLFRAWLKTIVVHTAIDHLRKKKNELSVIHIDSVQETGEDDFHIYYKWNHEQLVAHLLQLPPVTRLVVNLVAFDGYSHKEIATALNISETTSRWHLAEARKRLKQLLHLNDTKMSRP